MNRIWYFRVAVLTKKQKKTFDSLGNENIFVIRQAKDHVLWRYCNRISRDTKIISCVSFLLCQIR